MMNIQTTKTMRNNRINIVLNDIETVALIDTGACKSCINAYMLRKINVDVRPLDRNEQKLLFSADGRGLNVLGTVNLDVNLEGCISTFNFYVLENLSQGVILGSDFLNHFKCKIDCQNQVITFLNNKCQTPLLQGHRNQEIVGYLKRASILQPSTEYLLPILTKRNIRDQFFIEGLTPTPDQNFLVARTLIQTGNNATFCRVVNFTDVPIRINRMTKIAKLIPVNNDHMHICPRTKANEEVLKTLMHINTITDSEMTFCKQGHPKNTTRTTASLGITLDKSDLNPTQKQQLTRLLDNNTYLFATTLNELPGTRLCEFSIETENDLPINLRPYRQSPTARRIIDKEITEMLDANIIRESDSAYGAPCLLVRKKSPDGKPNFQLVIDYRKLNAVTKPIAYQIPRLDDIIDAVGHESPKFFSIMDLKSGYFQVPVREDSKRKTAFNTATGRYEFNVTPF